MREKNHEYIITGMHWIYCLYWRFFFNVNKVNITSKNSRRPNDMIILFISLGLCHFTTTPQQTPSTPVQLEFCQPPNEDQVYNKNKQKFWESTTNPRNTKENRKNSNLPCSIMFLLKRWNENDRKENIFFYVIAFVHPYQYRYQSSVSPWSDHQNHHHHRKHSTVHSTMKRRFRSNKCGEE